MKVAVLLVFLFTSVSLSQFDDDMSQTASPRFSPISFEAIPFWNKDTTSIELSIFYRIHPEYFFFAKTSHGQQELYEAKGEILFEIFDDKDAAISRELRPLVIERKSLPEEGIPPSDEIHGALTFTLKRGSYKIVLEAKDIVSNKSFVNSDMKIDARHFSAGLNISPAIFVEPTSFDTAAHDHQKFFPINHGGRSVIGTPGGCLFQLISSDTLTDIHLSWEVNNKKESDDYFQQELRGERFYQAAGTPEVTENPTKTAITLRKDSRQSRVIFIPIPLERLEPGRYHMSITVTQGAMKSQKEFMFNVIWPLKPHSLSDFKLAVDALRHIATDSEIDSMSAFSSSKSRNAFREFWQKRNPDSTRAYNSSLAEYYRRVDETIKRFSTGNEADGYRTDRGRIYILFGSPTFMNRLLKPNSAPTEIWTYEKLRRRFIFTDQRKTGIYTLLKLENY